MSEIEIINQMAADIAAITRDINERREAEARLFADWMQMLTEATVEYQYNF